MTELLHLQGHSPLPEHSFQVTSTKISSNWTTAVCEGLTIPYTALRIGPFMFTSSEWASSSIQLINFHSAPYVFVHVLQEADAKIRLGRQEACCRKQLWGKGEGSQEARRAVRAWWRWPLWRRGKGVWEEKLWTVVQLQESFLKADKESLSLSHKTEPALEFLLHLVARNSR